MRITTLKQFQEFCSHLNWNCFAFDTETTGLDYFELQIQGVSLADGKHSCYVDLWQNSEQEQLLKEFWMYLSSAGTIIGHNLTFDLKVLTKVYTVNDINSLLTRVNLIDTYLADYLIDERNSHKLKGEGSCCERYLGRKATEFEDAKKHGPNSPEFAKYAEDDAVNTWDVWKVESPLLDEQDLRRVFDVECKFIPAQLEMELTGVLVNQDLLKQYESDLDIMKLQLEDEIVRCLGPEPTKQGYMFGTPPEALGLDSPKKMQKLINEKFHIDTNTTDNRFLEDNENTHPFFKLFRKYRAVSKLLSTFVTPYWDMIKPDQRLHCEYHILRSGRLTATKPKLDNLAKENDLIPEVNVRKVFRAKPGYKYLKIDVSGQELRIAANNSGDKRMINAFQKDYDVHMVVTKKRLNLDIPWEHLITTSSEYKEIKKKYEDERTRFKTVNFGTLYGKTMWSFAKEWGCDAWEAKEYIDTVFGMFPKLKDSIARNKAFVKKNLYSVTWMGRRRRYDLPLTKHDFRSSFNHTVQGSAADMMKKAVGEIWRYLQILDFEAKIVLWIHDELLIEAPENRITELIEPVSYRLNNAIKCKVLFKSEVAIVNTYGG